MPAILRRLAAALALLAALAAVPAALAQEPPAGGASPDEAVERLLEVLRDDSARAALIARLEADAAQAAADAAETPASVAERLAETTAAAAAETAGWLSGLWREFSRFGQLADQFGPGGEAAALARAEAPALLLTVGSTIAVYLLLSIAVAQLARRLDPPVGAGLGRRAQGAAVVLATRLAAVALAWLAGYALAVWTGADGRPSEAQSLYLNAFAVFGVVRSLLRAAVSPDADREPSASSLAPAAQAVVYRALRGVGGVAVYGLLFAVPLAQHWAGFAAARPVRTLAATLAALLALAAVRRIARAVDATRGDRVPDHGGAVAEGAASLWRRAWPPLAVIYVLYAWLTVVLRPAEAAELLLEGTLWSAAALALLLLALRLAKGARRIEAPLPAAMIVAAPRIKPRADTIASAIGWAVAAVLAVAAVAALVGGWGWVDLGAALREPSVQAVLWRLLSAALVALAAAVIWAAIASWIDGRLAPEAEAGGQEVSARSRTLLALFRNAFTIAIGVLAVMVTLSQLGIDIAPLLAGAGVIGLAIGFGAQKLVQDIITGVFIQLENAMNEGDVVGVAGITGGVEKITIRSVRLRTLDGAAHVVPFSSVDTVTNLTREFSFHVAEIGVAYKEKVPDVKAAMEEAFERLKAEGHEAHILAPLEMHGVTALADSAVIVRARIKTLPGKQWDVGRRYTELVKEVMDERGIEIPFPHRQIVLPEALLPKPRKRKEGGRPERAARETAVPARRGSNGEAG